MRPSLRSNLVLLSAGLGISLAAGFAAPPTDSPYVWRQIRLGGGGFVSGVAYHPVEPGLLYARTDVGGAYRWDSSAGVWIPLNNALDRANNALSGVLSLAMDPQDANRVFLACGEYTNDWEKGHAALLWSEDRGASWQLAALPFKLGGNEDGRSTGERLQVDPHDGSILLLGTNHDGLWMSTGGDRTAWKRVNGFPSPSVTFVLFDRLHGKPGHATATMYAGSSAGGAGLFQSTDGGVSWRAVPGQPAGLIPHHAAQDEAGMIYLTYANGLGPNGITAGGVWRFSPAENLWADLSPVHPAGEDRFGYAGLAIDPGRPGTIVVTTLDRWSKNDEIFRSTDGGKTWHPLLANASWDHSAAPYIVRMKPHWIGTIALDPSNPDSAVFGTGYGVWVCGNLTAADSGGPTHWNFRDEGLEETVALALVSPPAGAPLLSAFYDVGGFRHDDLSVSPSVEKGEFAPGNTLSLDFAETRPELVVRTHVRGTVRASFSRDGGAHWTLFENAPPFGAAKVPGGIAISSDGHRLVWLPGESPAYQSSDNGATWAKSRGSPVSTNDYRTMRPTADRVNPSRFYIYDFINGVVYASADGGASFSAAASGLPVDAGPLAACPGQEGSLWLPTAHGLFRSGDAGRTFVPLPGVDEGDQLGFGKPAPGQDRPAVFLSGKVGGVEGLFRSDDWGVNWVRISDAQHRYGSLRTLIGDPRVYGRVYLGTDGRGLVYGEPGDR